MIGKLYGRGVSMSFSFVGPRREENILYWNRCQLIEYRPGNKAPAGQEKVEKRRPGVFFVR